MANSRNSMTSTTYSVQCDNGKHKFMVAHSQSGKELFCDFVGKAKAVEFPNKNREESQNLKFRLVKTTRKTEFGEWN